MKYKEHLKKIYIFDLDHTLFNARKFRQDIGTLLSNNPEMIAEDIWNYFDAKDDKLFTFVWEKADQYVFPEVVESIKNLEGEKVLLTFGNKDFQELKVKSIFFDAVFDKVFLTDENKVLFLQDFVNENPGRDIIFINDNYNKRFNKNTEITKSIPKIKVIEVDNYQLERNIDIKSIFKNL
jgi:FMN phosphatase YigB (HAD superfamily)